jgi:recombination protein RecT
VAYGTTATFQLGYRGLIQLALRSGQYKSMREAVINEEAFGGYDEVGEPIINWSKIDEDKDPVGYCFAWQTVNGFKKTVYWTRKKCLSHGKKFSRSFSKSSSPWVTNTDAMCLKTVIRAALSKYGILSIELQTAMTGEDVELTTDPDGTLIPKGRRWT